MGRQKLLNVDLHLKRVKRFMDSLIEDNGRFDNGLFMPTAYVSEARGIRLITDCILHKKQKALRKIQRQIRKDV